MITGTRWILNEQLVFDDPEFPEAWIYIDFISNNTTYDETYYFPNSGGGTTLVYRNDDTETYVYYTNGTWVNEAYRYVEFLNEDDVVERWLEYNAVRVGTYKVELSSNVLGLTPYQSDYEVDGGDEVTIRAREIEGYVFKGWSDGDTNLERTITVFSNISLVAQYEPKITNETYYQHRGFIKDQLDLSSPPKAWIVTKSDNCKTDLLTKATSTIEVQEMPSNVNEGDVIVLFTPTGEEYYEGVINKVSGTKITCSQITSLLKGTFNKSIIQHVENDSRTIEGNIAVILQYYLEGIYYGSDYTDTLIAQKYSSFDVSFVGSEIGLLETDFDEYLGDKNTQYDMEQFIYDLYAKYNVIVEVIVNALGTNYIHIFKPSYSQITIMNNQNAITDLSPITTVEETNRLIIFNANKNYRTTYVARKDGSIVEEPTSTANRFEVVNTKVVYSDDSDETLISANLPTSMYNHKLTFSLFTENNLYKWQDFKLGMPLHIFIDGTFFDTVLTGREIIHNENQYIKQIKFTCGKVRVDLVSILNTHFGRSG